jgi:RND family efflux transporter MFP subunit
VLPRDMAMFHRRTKRAVLGFLALGLLVAGVLAGMNRYIDAQRERRRSEVERKELLAPPPVPVIIESAALERMRKFTATLEPWMSAGVPAEVAGRVVEAFVEAGDRVALGKILIKLDASRAQILLDAASLRMSETERLLKEAERLRDVKAISATAYESALSEARIARAVFAEARDTVQRHTVKAPFDGTVNARLVDVGDAVNVNEPVVDMVDLNKLRAELFVSENDLSAFPLGTKLPLRLASGLGGKLEPVVRFVSRSADPATRLFKVEAVLENAESSLPGGIQGSVDVTVQEFSPGPVIPAVAVRFAGADAIVIKDMPEGPLPVKIKVGPEIRGKFPVLEGLQPGDKVYIQ